MLLRGAYCCVFCHFTAQVLVFLSLCIAYATAQDLSIPSSWLDPNSTLPRAQREGIASGAADALRDHIDATFGSIDNLDEPTSTTLFSVLSSQDFFSGNTSYESIVTASFEQYINQHGFYAGPQQNNDPIYWGLAAFYAYRAYKSDVLLNISQQAYNLVFPNFITADDAASGTGAGRNVTFSRVCNSTTTAGGVFWHPQIQNETLINAETMGPFMALSAYMYEINPTDQFKTAAQLSLDFLIHHMYNNTIVQDTVDVNTCQLANPSGVVPTTYEQGWFIEGLSIWANVTNNATLFTLLDNAVPLIANFSQWTLSSGIISESNTDGNFFSVRKGILIRGLLEAYFRRPGTDLAKFIESYVTVQYNSILDNARAPNTDFYSTSWFGPSNATFNPVGNIAALNVLTAALTFVPPDNKSTTNPGAPNSPPPANLHSVKPKTNVGAIVGGVVGGVSGVLAILAVYFFIRRRRGQRGPREMPISNDMEERSMVVEPFVAQHSSRAQSSSHVVGSSPFGNSATGITSSSDAATSSAPSSVQSNPLLAFPVSVGHRPFSKSQRMNAPFSSDTASIPQTVPVTVGHRRLSKSQLSRPSDADTGNMQSQSVVASSSQPDLSTTQGSTSNANDDERLSGVRLPVQDVDELPMLVNRLNRLLQAQGQHSRVFNHDPLDHPPEYE